MTKRKLISAVVATLALTFFAGNTHADEDPFSANFFSPELVMDHQADIELKDSQRQNIVDEIKKSQSNMVDIQFKMKAAAQELINVIKATKVDEAKAISALQKLTKVEQEMKTVHVTLMVRIKNTLTKEQQEKLRKVSAK